MGVKCLLCNRTITNARNENVNVKICLRCVLIINELGYTQKQLEK